MPVEDKFSSLTFKELSTEYTEVNPENPRFCRQETSDGPSVCTYNAHAECKYTPPPQSGDPDAVGSDFRKALQNQKDPDPAAALQLRSIDSRGSRAQKAADRMLDQKLEESLGSK